MVQWQHKLKHPTDGAIDTNDERAFWKDLLGDTLIEQKEEALKDASPETKEEYAAFSNALRKAIHENFAAILELDQDRLKSNNVLNAFKKQFIESYHYGLREYAIQTESYNIHPDVLLAKFKDARKDIDDANAAYETAVANGQPVDKAHQARLEKYKVADLYPAKFNQWVTKTLHDHPIVKDYKDEFLHLKQTAYIEYNKKIEAEEATDLLAADNNATKNLLEKAAAMYAIFKYRVKEYLGYYTLKNTEYTALLEEAKKDQQQKERVTNHQWWAVLIALVNSKYFSLSCGTTMGGALIIIAAPYGTEALIGATIIAVPVVYLVTRADWWLTNRALPELALKMSKPIEFMKEFWNKLKKRPISTLYNVIVSFVVTVVWAALTYDTTLELTRQLYEKSTISGEIASFITLGISGLMAVSALVKLYKSYIKNNRIHSLKAIWAMTIAAIVAGIGYWALGANAVEFQNVSIMAMTVMMTFFTAPAVYTVFNLYTDKCIKAFHGEVDEETKEKNAFHPKNVDATFDAIVDDARAHNEKGLNKFKTTYKVIMGIGLFLSLGASLMIQQMILGQEISFTTLPDYTSLNFWASMAGSLLIVGISAAAVFTAINSYTNANKEKARINDGIGKDMLYKSLVVLGVAALIGTFAIVTASNNMMGIMFTEWFGAPKSAVPVLNGVFTMGIGFLGAAGFYFGSAINTVKTLFKMSDDSPNLADPTGRVREPDLSKTIYENKSLAGKTVHHVTDSLDWFGTDPTKKEAFFTIICNAIANSFQTIMSATSVVAAALFSGSAAVGSAGANWGMNNTVPHPYPKAKNEAAKTEMLTYLYNKENPEQNNASKKSNPNLFKAH